MKELFTMCFIAVTVSENDVQGDQEAVCFTFCNAAQYRDERKCSHKSISENTVQKIVRSELTRQMQLAGFKKKDMSAMSNDIFSAKILEIQNEIKKLDAEVEQRSEKLAQAFMQYKDEKLSKENYMEMREERNNWKMFCEERKETLEQMIRRLQKQQKEETRFYEVFWIWKGQQESMRSLRKH